MPAPPFPPPLPPSDAAAAAFFLVRNLAVASVLGVTALVTGRSLLEPMRRAGPVFALCLEDGLETAAVAATLGLVALAHAGLLLGTLGWLRPGPVLLTLAALNLASRPGWRWLARTLREGAGSLLPVAIGTGALVPFVALALYPPVAFDATLYHLPYARAFVATGALPFLPDLRFPVFPQLQEVLFALGMTLADDVTAQLLALAATLLTCAILLCWGRRLAPGAGWIAAAVYAGCPIVVYLAATAYVEAGLVLFFTAALFAVGRWREGGGEGWLPLAAVLAAAAADSKYLGLIALALVVLVAATGRPDGEAAPEAFRWRRLLTASAAGALVLAPWTWRIVAATGNPIFPFLASVFGSSPWSRPFSELHGGHSLAGVLRLLGGIAWSLLRAPWDTVMERARTGGYPPYSPLLLLGLPFALAAAANDLPGLRSHRGHRGRQARLALLCAAAYGFAAFSILPDARYLLPAVPLVCLALGTGVARWLAAWAARQGRPGLALRLATPWTARMPSETPLRAATGDDATWQSPAPSPDAGGRHAGRPWPRRAAAVVALGCALPGWLYAGYRLVRSGPLPLTPAARQAFVARTLPLYSAILHLGRACGPHYTLYGLHAENMAYFATGRFLGDWSGPAAYRRIVPADGDTAVFHQRLRALGADLLLMTAGDPYLPAIEAAAGGGFRPVYADGHARLFSLDRQGCLGGGSPPPPPAGQR